MTPRDRTAAGRFRILAVANETVEAEEFLQFVADHAGAQPAEVLVVAPGLGDDDGRLERAIERLTSEGIHAYGWAGNADPLQAIAGALAVFEADELIIATHPAHRSKWLEQDVVGRARERFGLPTEHVVVDVRLFAMA